LTIYYVDVVGTARRWGGEIREGRKEYIGRETKRDKA